MRPAPTVAPNKYNLHSRVQEVEVVAANALTAAKEAHELIKRQPLQGERGATGPAGISIKGDAGRDGVNGKDGRDAVGVNGHHGTNGRDGKDGAPGPDSAAVLAETRAELANVLRQFADLKLQVEGVRSMMTQGADYIQYLRAKSAARIAATQEKKQ
jgi:hypothetical protein